MKLFWQHILMALLTGNILTACSGGDGGKNDCVLPEVTVSIAPYAYFVSEIGGDSVKINVLMQRDSNPESFEPGVATMKLAAGSDIYFTTGTLPYEKTVVDRLSTADGGNLKVVDTSRGIKLLHGTHGACTHHHEHGGADPHVWSSPRNARVIAANILAALQEVSPSHAEYYKARFKLFDARLDSLDCAMTERLAPHAGEVILVWHPSLSYLASDYGLKQVSLAQDGKEMSPVAMKERLDMLGEGNPVIFIQEGYDSDRAREITQQTDGRVVEINPLSPDWFNEINRIADAID